MGDPPKSGRSPRRSQSLDLTRETILAGRRISAPAATAGRLRHNAIDGAVIRLLTEIPSVEDKFLP
jgi:hypothetical protein